MNPDERFMLHLIFEKIKMILSYNTHHTIGIPEQGGKVEPLAAL